MGGAARERSQPLKTSVSGLGCWQQPESRVGGRWRLKKGPNPKRACFWAWDGWGKVRTRWWWLVRGWNPKNEHEYSFSELEGGGGGKQRWSKPRKRVRMLVFGVGRGMVESVNM